MKKVTVGHIDNTKPQVAIGDFTIPHVAGTVAITREEMGKFYAYLEHAEITESYIIAFPFAIIKISNNNFGVFVTETGEIPNKFIHSIEFIAGGTIEECCEYISTQFNNVSVDIFPQVNIAEIRFSYWYDLIYTDYEDTYSLLSTIQNETYIYFVNILDYKVRIESRTSITTDELINTAIEAFNREYEQTRTKYLSDVLTNGIEFFKVKVGTTDGFETYNVSVDFHDFKLARPVRYNEYLDTYHFSLD